MKKRIVLSYGEDEYLPIFVDIGHNLKSENVFQSNSTMVVNMPSHYVLHYNVDDTSKKFDILVTHHIERENKEILLRGFLYYNNKEFVVVDHRTYATLQVGKWCYDNVCVFKISENPFN
jgi:hypothetical protein